MREIEIKAVPVSLNEANEYVRTLHRHHDSVHRDKIRYVKILNLEAQDD